MKRLHVLLMTLLMAVAVSFAAAPALSLAATRARPVKVMTRNLYLGADLTPLLTASSQLELARAATAIFEKVQATNFPARAKVLAREIQDADPSLIGLQEVALWRTGEPGVLDGPATPATNVVYDFLHSLQSELATLGMPYKVVIVQSEFDGEVPSTLGYDIRLTQRDVILAKANLPADELVLSTASSGNYTNNLILPTVAGPFISLRGWTAADVTVNQRTFRFINTHLEAYSPYHRWLQMSELLSGAAGTTLPVILVGDLNSDPRDPAPSAYQSAIAAGFVDTWLLAHPTDPGFTCCNAENLLNPVPTFDSRIDHVLSRPLMRVFRSKIVGTDQDNRTRSGLWPSDHAGIVTTFAR